MWDVEHCLPCPAGFLCSDYGIADYTLYPCRKGEYCMEEAKIDAPVICPAGYYQPYEAKTSADDCIICPEGHFCREGADYPTPCSSGYKCGVGETRQYACRPGSYCPAMSTESLACPESFYCPSYATDIYAKCTNGTYCGESTRFPSNCPAGYFGSSNTTNIDLNSGCFACGKGQYSNAGSNTCETCYDGFICNQAAIKPNPRTEAEGGYICPPGSYCPAGSTVPIACPLGKYSDKEGNGFANQCIDCPANYFSVNVGATSCEQCQGATISEEGSTSCRCQGLNRKYLADKGKCVCQTGYEPVDNTDPLDDGFADCTLIIYPSCQNDETRDSNGKCRKFQDCSTECDGGEGQV